MDKQQTEPVISRHIEQTPGIRSGKPRVKGTRVTVADIVLWTEQGLSPDQIVTEFSQVDLADVHAALAYYHDNRTIIDSQIRDSHEMALKLKTRLLPSGDTPGTEADGSQVPS